MLDSWMLVPGVLVVVTLGIATIALLPGRSLLVALILVRSVSDVGATSSVGPLLPSTAISGLVGLTAIFALIIPSQGELSSRVKTGSVVVVAAAGVWTIVSISRFGVDASYANELIRTLSFVAVLLLAYRIGTVNGENLPRWTNWLVFLPAMALIAGYLIEWTPMLNVAGRAAGTFGHANQAAAYFAVGVVGCIWGYWRTKRKASLIAAFVGLVALLLTQSLGAFVAVGAGAIVLFAINSKMSHLRRVFLIVTGLGGVLILFFLIGASGRLAELENVNYGDAESDNSLDWRFVNWQYLIAMWRDEAPLLGFGHGSTGADVQPMGQLPHSVPVQLVVETGLVGSVLVGALLLVFVGSVRRRVRGHPETAAALAAISAVVVVHGIAANWLNYSAAQYFALFMVGALLGYTKLKPTDGQTVRTAGAQAVHPGRA